MSEQKVSPGQRERMIAEAAYFRAERRGFRGGDAVHDWCEAEAEVDARLRQADDEELMVRIEEGLAAAGRKLGALKRRMTSLSADARADWQKDLDRIAVLRERLKPQLAELRQQGDQAGQRLREQADRLRSEMAELIRRLAANAKH
jgi:chromosome segregation ATPase